MIILYHWIGDFPLKILKYYIAFWLLKDYPINAPYEKSWKDRGRKMIKWRKRSRRKRWMKRWQIYILKLPTIPPSWVRPCACVLSRFSYVWLCVTPQTIARPPGSSAHGILQARILEWVAMPLSRGSSQPRGRTCVSYVSCTGLYKGRFFTTSATWEAPVGPYLDFTSWRRKWRSTPVLLPGKSHIHPLIKIYMCRRSTSNNSKSIMFLHHRVSHMLFFNIALFILIKKLSIP